MNRFAQISLRKSAFIGIGLALLLCQPGCSKENSEPKAALKLGKTMTQTSMSSSTTSTAQEHAAISAKRAVLLAGDSHDLTRRIVRLLAEKLKSSEIFESIEQPGTLESVAEGKRGPDVFIHVSLGSLETTGITTRTSKAKILGACGTVPWSSKYHETTESTPPVVHFSWNVTAEVDSSFTGLRTDKYGELAQDVARQFASSISNQVSELSRKHAALPELPSVIYGPYHREPEFEFLKQAKARRAFSYYGLLTHNETFWRFEIDKDPAGQLEKAIAQLEADGWKTDHKGLSIPEGYTVRMSKEAAELSIFANSPDREAYTSASTKSQTNFCAHYRELFTREERHAALEVLFQENAAADKLLSFQNMLSPAQRKRFLELVDKGVSGSPGPMLWRAERHLAGKETNSALQMIVRAKALAVAGDNEEAHTKIRELAEKASPKNKAKLTITPEVCRELGMRELEGGDGNFEARRSFGEPLTVFRTRTNGVEISSMTIKPERDGVYPWQFVQWMERSKSSASGSFNAKQGELNQTFTENERTMTFTGKPSADGKEIKIKVRYQERKRPTAE